MKIFEIPIYAFSKSVLQDRVKKWRIRNNWTSSKFNFMKKHQKKYEYNHIVGFIEIGIDRSDIYGGLYLPCSKGELGVTINGKILDDSKLKHRYVWHTTRKVFLENQGVNGMHFYLGDLRDNPDVVKNLDRIMNQLKEIVLDYNKSYYIDLEAYNTIKGNIDYLNIYKCM